MIASRYPFLLCQFLIPCRSTILHRGMLLTGCHHRSWLCGTQNFPYLFDSTIDLLGGGWASS